MGDIINRRFSRRGFLGGSLAVTAIATTVSPLALMIADEARAEGMSAFRSPKSRPASTKPIMLPKAMMPMCCCAGVTRFSPTRPSSIR
jgi:secreted PhoX family phosphatase